MRLQDVRIVQSKWNANSRKLSLYSVDENDQGTGGSGESWQRQWSSGWARPSKAHGVRASKAYACSGASKAHTGCLLGSGVAVLVSTGLRPGSA